MNRLEAMTNQLGVLEGRVEAALSTPSDDNEMLEALGEVYVAAGGIGSTIDSFLRTQPKLPLQFSRALLDLGAAAQGIQDLVEPYLMIS